MALIDRLIALHADPILVEVRLYSPSVHERKQMALIEALAAVVSLSKTTACIL
jgi:hypothetical protein